MPRLKHILEFTAVRAFYLLFELMPLGMASAVGGWLGRTLGPLFPISNIARRNLRMILPERAAEHKKIIRGMWNNFGRVFAEYPHLKSIAAGQGGARIDIVGEENFNVFRAMARGGVIITAHLANWEFGPYMMAARGLSPHIVYRPPNNPLVDRLLSSARSGGAASSIPKGAEGARQMIKYLKGSDYIAVLIDQKMNDGIPVDFMGRPAMTVHAPAQLAIKYQVPICLARCERIQGTHFRWTVMPPFIPPQNSDVQTVMTQLNEQIGDWVRARPEQWLWIHRRWGKD